MFDGLTPEVEDLLQAASSDLPAAHAPAGLLRALADAVDVNGYTPSPTPRSKSMLGKVLTAKALAIAGVLVLTGGAASAATGTLPDPAQDVASETVSHVGLHIPKSDEEKQARHPENHGKDVSGVAHDKEGDGDGNHGARVCAVASEGKCKTGEDSTDDATEEENTPTTVAGEDGKSADHRQDTKEDNPSQDHRKDGEHRKGADKDETTPTTVNDDSSDD
jgi:hypothetical protein